MESLEDAGEFAREYASYFFGSPVADDFWQMVQCREQVLGGPSHPPSESFDDLVFIDIPLTPRSSSN